MGKKIRPDDYAKRCAKSQSYQVWKEEKEEFLESTNPQNGILTPVDMLYGTRKSRNTILGKEYIEGRNYREASSKLFAENYHK